jgi:plastocyanin
MRKLIATVSVLCLIAGIGAYAAFATTPRVTWKIGTMKTVRIRHGQRVTWVFGGDASHNVKGPGFKSPTRSRRGYTYSHLFRRKGRFVITCTIHPGLMKTVVRVS